VALLAGHTGMDVRPVIETAKAREIMHLDPGDGLWLLARVRLQLIVQAQGVIKFLKFRRYHGAGRTFGLLSLLVFLQDGWPGCRDKAMAIHTKVGCGNTRVPTCFRSRMAIKTRDLQLPGVISVRKGNGLMGLIILLVPRPIEIR
jgi:hypothetical protein